MSNSDAAMLRNSVVSNTSSSDTFGVRHAEAQALQAAQENAQSVDVEGGDVTFKQIWGEVQDHGNRLTRIEGKMDDMQKQTDKRFESLEDKMDKKFESMEDKMESISRVMAAIQNTLLEVLANKPNNNDLRDAETRLVHRIGQLETKVEHQSHQIQQITDRIEDKGFFERIVEMVKQGIHSGGNSA